MYRFVPPIESSEQTSFTDDLCIGWLAVELPSCRPAGLRFARMNPFALTNGGEQALLFRYLICVYLYHGRLLPIPMAAHNLGPLRQWNYGFQTCTGHICMRAHVFVCCVLCDDLICHTKSPVALRIWKTYTMEDLHLPLLKDYTGGKS
jgi:hypothetical protein